MKTLSFNVPAMYGDHHVLEVRRLLFALPGVADVYASSTFHVVEVEFDESQLDPDKIEATLDGAGYLGEIPIPTERETPLPRGNGQAEPEDGFFRHTAAQAATGNVVGFARQLPVSGRPLWPCPGMGPLTMAAAAPATAEEDANHG